MMSVWSYAGAGIQITTLISLNGGSHVRSDRCASSFLLGHESGHSIARPIACGNRVPPQRTVLGETTRPPVLLA